MNFASFKYTLYHVVWLSNVRCSWSQLNHMNKEECGAELLGVGGHDYITKTEWIHWLKLMQKCNQCLQFMSESASGGLTANMVS